MSRIVFFNNMANFKSVNLQVRVYFSNLILSLFSFPHRLSCASCDAGAEYPTVDRSRHERQSELPS